MSQIDKPTDTVPPRMYEHDFVAIRRCKHGTFLYNVHDLFISQSLDRYGEWCEAELDVLGQVVRAGDVVLDVGANIGTHTVFLAKRVTEQGCVFAFEPQRLVFQTLCANVALNALVNVIARQQAVGKRTEMIQLPVFDPRRDMNFGAVPATGHAGGEPVDLVRIDDFRLGRCDLIKVDVEGMECDVLEGARETIARHRPVLFVENNTLERSRATITLIDSLGYDAYWHISNYFNPGNYNRNQENIFASFQPEANLICFHRSRTLDIHGFQKIAGPHDTWRRVLDGMLASSTNEE